MPIRLIGTIILLILVTIFAGVNLDNKCDITFIFYTFEQVPVFMTIIISFAIGLVLMLPFTLGRGKKNTRKPVQSQQNKSEPKEESKTLFDFKIKREAKSEKSENEKTKNEKDSKKNKKSVFGFGKKNPDEAKIESASTASVSSNDSSENGAPV